jgi:hypothetical protein
MNMQNVKKSASIVNYVKPGLEIVEMEIEGSLLLTASFTTGPGGDEPPTKPGDPGAPGGIGGGGGIDLFSSRSKVKRR